MSAQHKLTTVLQMAYALMWTDHFNVYANQDLQEMEKRAVVGKEYKLVIQKQSQNAL